MNLFPQSINLCRVCLEEGAHLSLFEDADEMKLYQKVMACSAIQITETDGFPSYICPVCCSMLNTAYKFKKLCEDTDIKLRSCITKCVVKIEVEDINQQKIEDDYEINDSQDIDDFYSVPVKEESPIDILDVKVDEIDTVKKSISNKSKRKISKQKRKSNKNKSVKSKLKNVKEKNPKLKNLQIANSKKRIKKKTKVESNPIASSLLEGVCVWNGYNWRFASEYDFQEEIKMKKEADKVRKILEEERIEKANIKLRAREEQIRLRAVRVVKTLCDVCGQVFNSRNRMRVHQLSHKERTLSIKCPHEKCTKIFKVVEYMTRHYKRCHTEKREFICNECGKQFAFISSLRKHMKVHAGIVDWKVCPHCPQKYKTQKSVDIHVRSAHTGERPHVCTRCDSAFFHVTYLNEHMRLHTGETPFKCPICKRGYAQRGNMKSHMKQHRLSELDENLKATMKPNYLKLLRDQ